MNMRLTITGPVSDLSRILDRLIGDGAAVTVAVEPAGDTGTIRKAAPDAEIAQTTVFPPAPLQEQRALKPTLPRRLREMPATGHRPRRRPHPADTEWVNEALAMSDARYVGAEIAYHLGFRDSKDLYRELEKHGVTSGVKKDGEAEGPMFAKRRNLVISADVKSEIAREVQRQFGHAIAELTAEDVLHIAAFYRVSEASVLAFACRGPAKKMVKKAEPAGAGERR